MEKKPSATRILKRLIARYLGDGWLHNWHYNSPQASAPYNVKKRVDRIGEPIMDLHPDDREILKNLKSDDIKDAHPPEY